MTKLAETITPMFAGGGAVIVEHIPPNSVAYYLVTDPAHLPVLAARVQPGNRLAVHPASAVHRGAYDETLTEVIGEVLEDRGLAFVGLLHADGVYVDVESLTEIEELESDLASWLGDKPAIYGAYPLDPDAVAIIEA